MKKRIKLVINKHVSGYGYYFFRKYKMLKNEWLKAELYIDFKPTFYLRSYHDHIMVNYSRDPKNKYIYNDSKVYGINPTLKGWSGLQC